MNSDCSDFNPSHEAITEAAKYCSGVHQYCKEVYADGRKCECPFADAANDGLECQQLFAEELIAYHTLGTVEHLTELCKAEQKRQEGCRRCWNGECLMSGFDYSCETTCDKCQYNLRDKQFCPHCGRDLKGEGHDGD